jgi:WD40 repeat protein
VLYILQIWDPRDGSFVRSLKGHSSEVFAVRYSSTEQFLVSAGADAEILIWSMLTQTLNRRLLGHVDCIYG